MIIGVPKEIKQQEYRIALIPEAVKRLVEKSHTVLVEKSAGEGALFEDSQYIEAGARIVDSHSELFNAAELIVKVKEPLPEEYILLNEKHTLFAYLHLASSKPLTEALLKRGITGIAFETVETPEGTHPLLAPMSEIAGRVATLEGAKHLQRPCGGVGKLLATFAEGELAPKVVVIGAGVAGTAAARTAAALGGDVTVLDIRDEALAALTSTLNGKVTTLVSTPDTVKECLSGADLVVGAVYKSGDKAPHIVTREHLKLMKRRSVIVDIAIDQGGCVETSRPTTHAEPIFEVDGVIHYCVANMPGCVPVTSTVAISKAIAPYVEELADSGWREALRRNESLAKGLNVFHGNVIYEPIARLFGLPYMTLQEAIKE